MSASQPPRVNLHTHTCRCKHGTGTVADYCREAVKAGISILGFTDHCPFPDGEYSDSRMAFAEMPDYIREIEQARLQFPQLTILSGLELDYRPILGKQFFVDEFIDKYSLDYVISGAHHLPAANGRPYLHAAWENPMSLPTLHGFVRESIRVMELGLTEFLAHPDLTACSIPRWTSEVRSAYLDIIDAAEALNIPLEINAYGLRKKWIETPEGRRPMYPWHRFWELVAEHGGITVVASSDAHRAEDVWGNLDDAFQFARECGLSVENYRVARQIISRRNGIAPAQPNL